MSTPMPKEGRASLARNYRNLPEREIRAKLEGPMSEAERVTAKAELLRRHAGDNGPDTALATDFAPTSAFDLGAPEVEAAAAASPNGAARRRVVWPWLLLVGALAVVLGWAIHAKLVHPG